MTDSIASAAPSKIKGWLWIKDHTPTLFKKTWKRRWIEFNASDPAPLALKIYKSPDLTLTAPMYQYNVDQIFSLSIETRSTGTTDHGTLVLKYMPCRDERGNIASDKLIAIHIQSDYSVIPRGKFMQLQQSLQNKNALSKQTSHLSNSSYVALQAWRRCLLNFIPNREIANNHQSRPRRRNSNMQVRHTYVELEKQLQLPGFDDFLFCRVRKRAEPKASSKILLNFKVPDYATAIYDCMPIDEPVSPKSTFV
ncbi:hypothetical protein CANCADRAFT_89469 [Tortispora caseinolytica NRRL Y-17796]|uniref:PH domain-containing protein n=1 Tax=Tortispora caseinolytica NRRL Y-17796 TaxID=767744 RepID=A0A1E4TLK6_9ASCO|nr:hypothetical protein CANCADRAFT_89469 [Tortispora caseinolytica NRRL Y-17796]